MAKAVYARTESGDEYLWLFDADTKTEVVEQMKSEMGEEFAYVSRVLVDPDWDDTADFVYDAVSEAFDALDEEEAEDDDYEDDDWDFEDSDENDGDSDAE